MERLLVSGQRLRVLGSEVATQPVAIGIRQPDAVRVGDDHEPHVRALLDPRRDALNRTVRQFVDKLGTWGRRVNVVARDVVDHRRRGGHDAGDIQRVHAVLDVEAMPIEPGEQPERDDQRQRHDDELQQHHLGGESQVDATPGGHAETLPRE